MTDLATTTGHRVVRTFFVLSLVSLLACVFVCAWLQKPAPKLQQSVQSAPRFHDLREGMTKAEVAALLGQPASKKFKAGVPKSDSFVGSLIGYGFHVANGDYWPERWFYGDLNFSDMLLFTPDHAFIVCFSSDGTVSHWRAPASDKRNGSISFFGLSIHPRGKTLTQPRDR